jgi:hypothetical protein
MSSHVKFWQSAPPDLCHFRGHGRWNEDAWRDIGLDTVEALRNYGGLGNKARTKVVLEWGVGGGSNVAALEPYASTYYGADIAASSLKEAAKYSDNFVPINVATSVEIEPRMAELADVFVSTACFQHFPDRVYTHRVLRSIARATAPMAIGIIQIRTGKPDDGETYTDRVLSATTWSVPEFTAACKNASFDVLGHEIDGWRNYATFGLRRRDER